MAQPAVEIVSERMHVYGHPSINFARIAGVWNGLLAGRLSQPITPAEVALMMAGVKIARLMQSPDHNDSQVDVAGYIVCLRQILDSNRNPTGETKNG